MASEDIWHLSIDDLLATPVETPRLAGPGPFVINLSASTAPISIPHGGIAGFAHLRAYHTSRIEDGRTRHRLRLGLFATEAEVEAALMVLREHYPSAFAAAAGAEDLQIISQPAPVAAPAAAVIAPATVAPRSTLETHSAPTARPAVRKDAKRKPAKRGKPAQTSKPVAVEPRLPDLASEVEGILLAASSPAAKKPAPAKSTAPIAPVKPAASQRPLGSSLEAAAAIDVAPAAAEEAITEEVPILNLPLAPEAVELQASPPAAVPDSTVIEEPSALDVLVGFHALQRSLEAESPLAEPLPEPPTQLAELELAAEPPAAPVSAEAEEVLVATDPAIDPQVVLTILESPPAIKPPEVMEDAPPPDMDSTQTLRVLTPLELSDNSQSKWLVVELSNSEEPIDLAALPRLDIFAEYRLYAVNGLDRGKLLHSLRLGFFSEELSANVVAGYLRSFFAGAAVRRVSVAEHARFALRATAADENTALAPQSSSAAAIVLETKQSARSAVRPSPPASSTNRHPPAANSLWSRLFGANSKTGS